MGRNPKLRASYINDSQFMLRLAHAIENDKDRPVEWRKEMIGKLEGIASDLLRAPAANSATPKKTEAA